MLLNLLMFSVAKFVVFLLGVVDFRYPFTGKKYKLRIVELTVYGF